MNHVDWLLIGLALILGLLAGIGFGVLILMTFGGVI